MGLIDVKESAVGRAYVARMDFSAAYLQILALTLALLMGTIALVNWLNRRHGGFLNRHHKAEAFADNGADELLPLAVIPERLASRIDAAWAGRSQIGPRISQPCVRARVRPILSAAPR